MAGEIELLTQRGLVGLVGFDAQGLVGSAALTKRPYWGGVVSTVYPQAVTDSSTQKFGKYRITRLTHGLLKGSILRFRNVGGTAESAQGTTTIYHMGVELNGVWLGDITFNNGSLSQALSGTGVFSSDPITFDVPPGVLINVWYLVGNPAGIPIYPSVQSRTLAKFSGSAITDDLSSLVTTGMSSTDYGFSPLSWEGWTDQHTVVLLENSRGVNGFGVKGNLAPGDVAPALEPVACVINLGMSGQAMWQFGTDSTARNGSRDVVAPLATDIMIGDFINDGGTDITQTPGLYTKIVNNWDLNRRKFWAAKTTDPDTVNGTASISALSQTGGLATATVASTANMRTGQTVLIAGATPSAYNGTFVITVLDSTHFTFAIAGGTTSPATGTITYNDGYVGQTLDSGSGMTVQKDGNRQGNNYLLRSGQISDIGYVVDTAAAVEDAANPVNYAPRMNYPGNANNLHVSLPGQMEKMRKATGYAAVVSGMAYAL
jgi:hypothetical protein